MGFRLDTTAKDPETADDWPLPLRSAAMASATLTRLKDDLRRYCLGEIAGRSYLIAGHRGAGKTTLTLRAIEDIRYELLQAALNDETGVRTRRLGVQRPLLVKLHGPSLLEPVKAAKEAEEANEETEAPASGDGGAAPPPPPGNGGATPPPPPGNGGATPPPPGEGGPTGSFANAAHSVLVQIAVALYRQLAAEAALGFGVKATHDGAPQHGCELCAQLILDLDGGIEPAMLRSYWAGIGRLEKGVFWPAKTDQVKQARPPPGTQGLKEVLALAAAGQAYRKCAGDLTERVEDIEKLEREQEIRGSVSPAVKELVGRLGTLGVGALTGAALWPVDAPVAVGAGVLVWLLGTASLSWSFTNKRRRDRTATYTFLPNTKVETLDRDLPVVIQRIRDSGLSPVFVIDELDKVKESADTIADIIGRLKHIIADFGFFCFLTDRGYYDYVDARLQSVAYPTEHTFFGERRLLAYAPDDYRSYLSDILQPHGQASPQDETARDLLILHLIHRSRLNFTELSRELGRMAGKIARESGQILQDLELQVSATVQLAIEATLRERGRQERMEADPGFAHLLFDVLYGVSRAWSEESPVYEAEREKLLAALLKRANDGGTQSRRAPQPWRVSEADQSALVDAHADLIARLTDFGRVQAELTASTDPTLKRLAPLVSRHPSIAGLLSEVPGKANCYRFNYSSLGRPLVGEDAPIDPQEAEALRQMLAAFAELLKTAFAQPLTIDDLKLGRLLPATVDGAALAEAAAALERHKAGALATGATHRSLDAARSFKALLDGLGPKLGTGLMLTQRLVHAVGGHARAVDALAAHARYPVLGEPVADPSWSPMTWMATHPSFAGLEAGIAIQGDVTAIQGFAALLKRKIWEPASETAPSDAWEPWYERFAAYVQGTAPKLEHFEFIDLLGATRQEGPAAVLQADFSRLGLRGWSEFCLYALQGQQTDKAPRWAVVAGLRVLGFDQSALLKVATAEGPNGSRPPENEVTRAKALAAGAVPERLGALFVESDPNPLDANAAVPANGPALLYLTRSVAEQNDVSLDWLTRLEVLEGMVSDVTVNE